MKIRSGFVSNSSSSSFVLIGIKIDNNETKIAQKLGFVADDSEGADTIEEQAREFLYDYDKDEISYIADDYSAFIGKMLSQSSDDYMEETKFSFDKIDAIKDRLMQSLDAEKSEIALYMGTMQC